MKCLTIRQPFASNIVHGRKRVENRSRDTALRGLIAIHAGLRPHDYAPHSTHAGIRDGSIPAGSIVGTVHLVGTHRAGGAECARQGCDAENGALFPGDLSEPAEKPILHWELEAPRPFATPLKHAGQLGFWDAGIRTNHLIEIADTEQAPDRWSAAGFVCAWCSAPTEDQPCAAHQPAAFARYVA
jgi:hypothetical protein